MTTFYKSSDMKVAVQVLERLEIRGRRDACDAHFTACFAVDHTGQELFDQALHVAAGDLSARCVNVHGNKAKSNNGKGEFVVVMGSTQDFDEMTKAVIGDVVITYHNDVSDATDAVMNFLRNIKEQE